MEKGKDFIAKIVGREKEILISDKTVLIGRSSSLEKSEEINGKSNLKFLHHKNI
jgi:hypothetical protein